MNLENFLRGYITAALWSSTDNADDTGGEPLDANYGPDDIEHETLDRMREDCTDFIASNAEDLAKYAELYTRGREYGIEDCAGHDFWLTRNGHGVGFWDRGLGALGDRLADAARVYREFDLYVTDADTIADI